jgi:hypothetical protein
MSNMLSQVVQDDFVWTAVASVLTGTRRGANGAKMICCPMCPTRGETPDRRFRCGVMRKPDGVYIHCFNCGFVAEWKTGELISYNLKSFLERLGLPSRDVQYLNVKAMQYRRMIEISPEAQAIIPVVHTISFPAVKLPDGARSLTQLAEEGVTDIDFLEVADYLFGRGEAIAQASEFYWTPLTENQMNRRLIIPFYHDGEIVGYSGRYIDRSTADKPKYWTQSAPNYLFNNAVLDGANEYVFVVEGPTDALAIGGVATLGAKLSEEAARWLNTCGKKIIVIADRDKSGKRWIDYALRYGWMVSFPKLRDGHGFQNWWDNSVKDVAEATKEYGKLYAVRSIIASATAGKTEISVKQKFLY